MPKPLKKAAPKKPHAKKKRPSSDPVLRARQQFDEHMAKFQESVKPWDESAPAAPPTFEQQLSAHMAKLGAKGGKVGGKRRLETMTPDERSAAASKAARAMWAKRKRTKAK